MSIKINISKDSEIPDTVIELLGLNTLRQKYKDALYIYMLNKMYEDEDYTNIGDEIEEGDLCFYWVDQKRIAHKMAVKSIKNNKILCKCISDSGIDEKSFDYVATGFAAMYRKYKQLCKLGYIQDDDNGSFEDKGFVLNYEAHALVVYASAKKEGTLEPLSIVELEYLLDKTARTLLSKIDISFFTDDEYNLYKGNKEGDSPTFRIINEGSLCEYMSVQEIKGGIIKARSENTPSFTVPIEKMSFVDICSIVGDIPRFFKLQKTISYSFQMNCGLR